MKNLTSAQIYNNLSKNLPSKKSLILVGLSVVALSGCQNEPGVGPLSERAMAEARAAPEIALWKGAAILARVSFDGEYCSAGIITLHTVFKDKIDSSTFVNIGQTAELYAEKSVAELPKTSFDLSHQVKSISKEIEDFPNNEVFNSKYELTDDIRTSFRAITPGKYVITRVICWISDRKYNLGTQYVPVWGRRFITPVLGDNYIEIKEGQIVDAGVINIAPTSRFLFFSDRAKLQSLATPSSFKDAISKNFPEIARKVSYNIFRENNSVKYLPMSNQ